MDQFQTIVIGAGPGGYIAAIRCAQLGQKVALVEKYDTLGGTCLNVGCIPSKALLDSSEKYHEANKHFQSHGIKIGKLGLDWPKMLERKTEVVKQTCEGINFLMKKNKITVFHGIAQLKDHQTVEIGKASDKKVIKGENIILATGSKPSSLPGIEIDKKRIISSTEALKLKEVPKSLLVIGAGVIGLELGSVYARLGAQVTFVEFAPGAIPTMDPELGKELVKVLKGQGINFHFNHRVNKVVNKGKKVNVIALDKDNKEQSFEVDYCLMAVGRRPFTQDLGLENAGVKQDERGFIIVDDHLKTSTSNIYAIGDIIRGPMLAHKAEEEGVYVAEIISGQKPHINYNCIPGVVYTWPEIAAVGQSEPQLKEAKTPYKKGVFPFKASGRARASNDLDGFIKVLAHKETDEILGVHMIGPRAADMIAEAVLALEYKCTAEDIARVCHPHPTFTESLKEACLAATENRALHI